MELLVVVGVIAVLTAIIMPVLQSCRKHARTTLCMANIRELTKAFLMYEAENKSLPYSFYFAPGIIPPGGYVGSQYDRTAWWWFNFMELYQKDMPPKVNYLLCPAKYLTDSVLNQDILCGNYGVNQSICKSSTGKMLTQKKFIGRPLDTEYVQHPDQTLLVLDSGYSVINWWHAADTPPAKLTANSIEDTAYVPGLKINKTRTFKKGQELDARNGRHPGKMVNTGFVDGHAAQKQADELLVEKIAGGYKNQAPLWAPE